MRFLSLFSGIGGIDLGLERAGMTCIGQVEIDPWCRGRLTKHWPDVPKHGDVHTFEGTEFGPFDLLAGGYPCQPFSTAGKRGGDKDPRHLWPEVNRIIRRVRPRYVFLENVTGHLSLGFGRVVGDLAACGYDSEWDCIPASSLGAHHQRDRVFIVAYTSDVADTERIIRKQATTRGRTVDQPHDSVQEGWNEESGRSGSSSKEGDVAHTEGKRRREAREHSQRPTQRSSSSSQGSRNGRPQQARRTIIGNCRPFIESTRIWEAEPDVGRVVDGISDRVDRLRGLGNAVVPQVAELFGVWIMEDYEQFNQSQHGVPKV